MKRVAFGLGANLGDTVAALQGAVDVLVQHLEAPAVSSVYETSPVGGVEQPDYLNAVLVGDCDEPPSRLLALAHRVEQSWNRTRDVRWGPRTLDIDLLAVGAVVSDDPVLTLPHPRARERGFVLLPWAEADPDAVLPDGTRVADLAAAWRSETDRVQLRTDVSLVVHTWT
ncbi:MAG TPA: 2-amino-4-hydroxy-6-hydroxymethyldihydropteridine diphosphokinase [Candidatus Nanopelagicales bacterium]|nr:2-amino-4-hydroxy-6-hydroxymethyldihydropteridine diphosphokinase [Candidatus Nanopelagicales bacterium]